MDYRDLATLLLKLIGAVLLFWYVAWLPDAISRALQAGSLWQSLLFVFLPGIVPLVLGWFFFSFPGKITNKLVSGRSISSEPAFLAGIELVALRVIALFYLFRGSVDLVYHVSRAYARNRMAAVDEQPLLPMWFSVDEIAGIISTLVELAIAVWLLLGTRGILAAVTRLRGRNEGF